ncbi:MAG: site-specific integrase [Candidatus Desulfofervidaceae bacterium]|nr:site-specific integrase [Candidatus Desulfofervidaceae bacterium]
MAVVKKKDGRWFCVFYDDNGKQVWKSFGRGVEAKKAAQAFDYEIKAKKKKNIAITSTPKIDITHLAQEYLDTKRKSLHPHTTNKIIFLINEIVAPIISGKNITSLTKRDLLQIIKKLEERNLSQATINRYIAYLQAILNWGVKHDFIPHNPFAGYKKPKEEPYKTPIITPQEFQKLLTVAPEHLSWALFVEFYTGCRPGTTELFALKWEDINWEQQTLTIYGHKTKKIRTVFLNDAFFEMLKEKYQNRDSEYIISYKGKPVKSLKRSWATAKKKAGITKRLRLYDLRHAFATYMIAHGADVKAVSDMLGHSNTEITVNRYYQLVEDLKKKAVQLLPVFNLSNNPTSPKDPLPNKNVRQRH